MATLSDLLAYAPIQNPDCRDLFAELKLVDLNATLGKEVLEYIGRLSPIIRKYGKAKGAPLTKLSALSEEHEEVSL